MKPWPTLADRLRRAGDGHPVRRSIALACAILLAALLIFGQVRGFSVVEPLPDIQTFDIPSQPVGDAIVAFSEQAAIQLLVDPGIMGTEPSTAVRGRMPAEEALRRLLRCSQYRGRFLNAHTITIERIPRRCQSRAAR